MLLFFFTPKHMIKAKCKKQEKVEFEISMLIQ